MYKTRTKYLIPAVTIIVVVGISVYLLIKKNLTNDQGAHLVQLIQTESQPADTTNKTLNEANIDNQTATVVDLANRFELFQKCGLDFDLYTNKISQLNADTFDNSGINHLEKMLDDCDAWFEKLSTFNDEQFKSMEVSLKKKVELLSDLSVYEFNVSIISKARNNVSSTDSDIAGTALIYLLSYDYDFLDQITQRMDITDSDFLRSNLKLAGMFSCQQGLDCSATGFLMQDLCLMDETACDRSYGSWVREQITLNQYDDLLHALQVVNSILNSDWFTQRME